MVEQRFDVTEMPGAGKDWERAH